MQGISVIICTYNGRERIAPVLGALAGQRGLADTPVEVIVVDNASTDGTAEIAAKAWPPSPFEFRIVSEQRPGQALAREAGYAQSRGDLICWVDDDNILSPDYLARAVELMSRYPTAAICGGRGIMTSEAELPGWLKEEWGSHGCGAQGDKEGPVSEQRQCVYYGGAILRRAALEQLYAAGFKSLLSGRVGGDLMGSEDNEVCYALRFLGWDVIHSPDLTFRHVMPAQRLTWDYCVRLFYATGQSTAVANIYLAFIGNTWRRKLKRTRLGMELAFWADLISTWRGRRSPEPPDPHARLMRHFTYGRTVMSVRLRKSGQFWNYYREIKDLYRRCDAVRLTREKSELVVPEKGNRMAGVTG